jgi:peptide/nickel transport system permease protein
MVFFIVRLIPGDPVRVIAPQADPATYRKLRSELGLDKPVHEAYIDWVVGFLQGDLGTSIFTGEPVLQTVVNNMEPAISIGVSGLLIAVFIGVFGGIVSATNQYQWQDNVVTVLSFIGISMPSFWVGILLILTVGTHFEVIPGFGYSPISEGIGDWLLHILLPSLAIGLPFGGIILRFMRSSMLDVLDKQYMMTARSKGLSPKIVLYKHGLQNAIIPVITMSAIIFAIALAGVVAVEIVFGINAFGRLLLQSILKRDFPVIQGIVMIFASIYIVMMLLVDILYAIVNPKIRY